MKFGKLLISEFPLDPKALSVNHGSKGLPPNIVFDQYVKTIKEDFSFPDKFFFQTQADYYDEATEELAKIVGTSSKNLAIVRNATIGVNAVLNSIKWSKGDKIVISTVTYGSLKNAVKYLGEKFELEIIILDLDLEKGNDFILEEFASALKKDVKLCLFDMISSLPAYKFPYVELTKLCKKYNTISVNDAAHGIGLEQFSLDEFKPDFCVSNLHKWYFLPRGSAFLYVDPKYQKMTHPSPISLIPNDMDSEEIFYLRFKWGASDNLAALSCVKTAREYIESLGGQEKIWSYTRGLRDKVDDWLCERWGTKLYGNTCNQMSNVIVPLKFLFTLDQLSNMRIELLNKGCSLFLWQYRDTCFVRLSFQVYNEFEEYVKAIELFEEIVQRTK